MPFVPESKEKEKKLSDTAKKKNPIYEKIDHRKKRMSALEKDITWKRRTEDGSYIGIDQKNGYCAGRGTG